jgi:hypothetical protein
LGVRLGVARFATNVGSEASRLLPGDPLRGLRRLKALDRRHIDDGYDGSGERLPLTAAFSGTVFGPGVLTVKKPGQGIWNNGGDTIYLKTGSQVVVDAWDYRSQRADEGVEICRGDPQ